MTKRRKAKAVTMLSTKTKGDTFEEDVAALFEYMPGATVTKHAKIAGKDVDLYVEIEMAIGGPQKIAVDAKNYSKPLTREEASKEYSDYYPLIASKLVDQFLLVTRKGIVANAKEIFDGTTAVHYSYSELDGRTIASKNLIREMLGRFHSERLSSYYVSPKCFSVALPRSTAEYDCLCNEFISFCASRRITTFDQGQKLWQELQLGRGPGHKCEYTEDSFAEALNRVAENEDTVDLEELVLQWMDSEPSGINIALLGTYGTGKSSFAKRLAHVAATNYQIGESQRIPLLIELRHFGSHQSIEGLITDTLINKYQMKTGSYTNFSKMNSDGRFLLILDGFDEMKQGLTHDALVYNFNQLGKLLTPKTKLVLCGRPTMFESEDEQSKILFGGSTLENPVPARYVPVRIAPLDVDSVLKMIRSLLELQMEATASIDDEVKLIEHAINENVEIRDLLSRPVHVPMFVTIFPDYTGPLTSFSRNYLYGEFIRKIISREVDRLNAAYVFRYSTEKRFRFASALAYEMASRGETRSIRRSEIPDSILQPFVLPGESVETTKRDLLTSCFVEKKEPDILVFGHKSFLEFLAADHFVYLLRTKISNELLQSFRLTYDIGTFLLDMISIDDVQGSFAKDARLFSMLLTAFKYAFPIIGVSTYQPDTNKKILPGKNDVDSDDDWGDSLVYARVDLRLGRTLIEAVNGDNFLTMPREILGSMGAHVVVTLYIMVFAAGQLAKPMTAERWAKLISLHEGDSALLAALWCSSEAGLDARTLHKLTRIRINPSLFKDQFIPLFRAGVGMSSMPPKFS